MDLNTTKYVSRTGLILFLVSLTILVIASIPALTSLFVSDDFILVEAVKNRGPWGILVQSEGGFFRPLVSASLYLDYSCWHLDPLGYHLTNLIVHVLNSLLLCIIILQLLTVFPGSNAARSLLAMLGASLFLCLPSHSETIFWISARPDLLATTFFLAAWSCYFMSSIVDCPRYSWSLCSCIFFGLALASKESVLFFPGLVLACEFFLSRMKGRQYCPSNKGLLLVLGYILIEAFYFVIRFHNTGTIIGGYGTDVHLALSPVQLLKNALSFCSRTVLPALPGKLTVPLLFLGLLVIIGSLFLTRKVKMNYIHTPIWLLIVSFFLSLIPVFTLGVSKIDSQGERFLYLPSVFALCLLVVLGDHILKKPRKLIIAAIFMIIASIFPLHMNARNWERAGMVCKDLIADLQALHDHHIVCLANLPDNLRGAYIFRNGLDQALKLFSGPEAPVSVSILSWQTLLTQRDKPHLIIHNQGIELVLTHPGQYFHTTVSTPGPACQDYQAHLKAPNRLFIHYDRGCLSHPLLIFSDGRLFDLFKQ
ncbi:hypothetical protein JXQ70_09155 [bacterium]|nr:hypothetical protein [bacterium]